MRYANDLFNLVYFTKEQAIILCDFISEMPAGEDKFAQKNRQEAAYKWSILDELNVKKKI